MSPQTFDTSFQIVMHTVKLLDCCYEKELDNEKAKIIFFIHPQKNTSNIMYIMIVLFLIKTLWKTSRTSSKATTMQITKKVDKEKDHCNNRGWSSCHSRVVFTPCEADDTADTSTTPSTQRSYNWPCNQSCSGQRYDASQPQICNQ